MKTIIVAALLTFGVALGLSTTVISTAHADPCCQGPK